MIKALVLKETEFKEIWEEIKRQFFKINSVNYIDDKIIEMFKKFVIDYTNTILHSNSAEKFLIIVKEDAYLMDNSEFFDFVIQYLKDHEYK